MFLLQILLLRLAAVMAAGMLVKEGSEVTLTCDPSLSGVVRRCNGTMWNFSGVGAQRAVEVVSLGQLKWDGLSLAVDCSLVIQNVMAQNARNYECFQYQTDPRRPGNHILVKRGSVVRLHVVTVEKQRNEKEVKFCCSVSSLDPCGFRVRWNLGVVRVDENNQQIKREERDCSACMSIPQSHFLYSSGFQVCEVTDIQTGNVTIFRTSGVDGHILFLVVRNGDNVTLPCSKATTLERCSRPAWTFNSMSGGLTNVIESFRLSIATANCSLTITEVGAKDAGVYFCRTASRKSDGIQLMVVELVECRSEHFVALECKVTGPSNQVVRWTGVPDVEGVEQSMSQNFASVSFAVSHPVFVSREYQAWSCGVQDHGFALPAPFPGKEPGVSSLDVAMVVMHVVEVVLIAVVIVVLFRASGKRKWSGGVARKHRDGQEATINYENVGNTQQC